MLSMRAHMACRTRRSLVLPLAMCIVVSNAFAVGRAPIDTPPGGKALEGRYLRIVFDSAERGFNCIGIENRQNGATVPFCRYKPGNIGLWSLHLWRNGKEDTKTVLHNRSPCRRSCKRSGNTLKFAWRSLSPADENGTVDVFVSVSLTSGGDAAEWRMQVRNRSRYWGLASTDFPVIPQMADPGEATALLPTGNWGGKLVPGFTGGRILAYPSASMPVQTFAMIKDGLFGLQITSLDGTAQRKDFNFSAGLDFWMRYICPDEGRPGNSNAPDFAVETASFCGDWTVAAARYRQWALEQKWAAKGPLIRREDFCKRMGDVGFWMSLAGDAATVSNATARTLEAMPGIPIGVHWYRWHQIPFDNSYPEYFPEKPGVRDTVKWMKGRGVLVMPYMNAKLWDSEIGSFAGAFHAACKKSGGTTNHVEIYASKRRMAPMCPTTPLWRCTVAGVCGRIVSELGADAIYLDQVGASRPVLCYDPMHGHPIGGGGWWTQGYRDLLKPIRAEAKRRGVVMTTENTAEPYMDSFDGYLAWLPRTPEDVPMLPAVYSGHTVYFSSPQSPQDSIDSYCAMQGRDFLWGCAVGWNGPWILNDAHKEHLAFTARLCRERLALKDFMVYGKFAGEIPVPPEMPQVDVVWHRKPGERFRMSAVIGAVWKDYTGRRRCTVLVNISGNSVEYALSGSARTKLLPPRSVTSIIVDLDGAETVSCPLKSCNLLSPSARKQNGTLAVPPRPL